VCCTQFQQPNRPLPRADRQPVSSTVCRNLARGAHAEWIQTCRRPTLRLPVNPRTANHTATPHVTHACRKDTTRQTESPVLPQSVHAPRRRPRKKVPDQSCSARLLLGGRREASGRARRLGGRGRGPARQARPRGGRKGRRRAARSSEPGRGQEATGPRLTHKRLVFAASPSGPATRLPRPAP